MPDEKGVLTQGERRKAKKWVKDKWKTWTCPFSGHTKWQLGRTLVQTAAYTGGGGGGSRWTSLSIACPRLFGVWIHGANQCNKGRCSEQEEGQGGGQRCRKLALRSNPARWSVVPPVASRMRGLRRISR